MRAPDGGLHDFPIAEVLKDRHQIGQGFVKRRDVRVSGQREVGSERVQQRVTASCAMMSCERQVNTQLPGRFLPVDIGAAWKYPNAIDPVAGS